MGEAAGRRDRSRPRTLDLDQDGHAGVTKSTARSSPAPRADTHVTGLRKTAPPRHLEFGAQGH